MIKYYPYKSDKPNKKIIVLQTIIKKFILVRLPHPILLYAKYDLVSCDIYTPPAQKHWHSRDS